MKDGKAVTWGVETGSATAMGRQGVTPDTLSGRHDPDGQALSASRRPQLRRAGRDADQVRERTAQGRVHAADRQARHRRRIRRAVDRPSSIVELGPVRPARARRAARRSPSWPSLSRGPACTRRPVPIPPTPRPPVNWWSSRRRSSTSASSGSSRATPTATPPSPWPIGRPATARGAPRCRCCGWAASASTPNRGWTSWCRTCSPAASWISSPTPPTRCG